MKKLSQISFILSICFLLLLIGARYIIGGWIDILYVPLALFIVLFVFGLSQNYKLFIEFFGLKTTKHGLNMGTVIILVMLFVGIINYFGVRTNKNFDLTEEKLFTLAEQTDQILKGINKPLTIYIFYRNEQDAEYRRRVKDLLDLFVAANKNVQLKFVNAHENPMLAQKYITKIDPGQETALMIYVDYEGRVFKVDHPQLEEQFTQALVKATRSGTQKIYFLTGHGEASLNSQEEDLEGLSKLKQTLSDYSFEFESLSLLNKKEMPSDASALAIVGPKSQFAEAEIKMIEDYLAKGGRVFIALDPGQKTNLQTLINQLAVQFKDNYVFDPGSALGASVVISNNYSLNHPITKDFADRATVFNLASQVIAQTGNENIKADEIVKSNPSSLVVNDINQSQLPMERDSYSIAAASSGKIKGSEKEFSAVVFGDSDFLKNQFLYAFSNRDMLLNSIAFLSQQQDLISIRPKIPKSNSIQITESVNLFLIVSAILIPVVLLVLAFVVWYKRRGD